MSSASTLRQQAKNLKMSQKVKHTLTGFYYAGLLESWQRKAVLVYWIALLYCAADRELIRGLWKRPSTFPPTPIEVSRSISRALSWIFKSAQKFEAQHRSEINKAWSDRDKELEEMDRDRLLKESEEEEKSVEEGRGTSVDTVDNS